MSIPLPKLITRKVRVAKHNREGSIVEPHEREITIVKKSEDDKIREEQSTNKQAKVIDSLF